MTVVAIPLVATPAQSLTVQLGDQSCQIVVRQRRTGLYVDLSVQDVPIALGVLALNLVKIVRGKYLGFVGDLFFADTQGSDAPDYTGLVDRFLFLWDDAA
jgi:hypothetical protein